MTTPETRLQVRARIRNAADAARADKPISTAPSWLFELGLVLLVVVALAISTLVQRFFPTPAPAPVVRLAADCPRPLNGEVLVIVISEDQLGGLTGGCITARRKVKRAPGRAT